MLQSNADSETEKEGRREGTAQVVEEKGGGACIKSWHNENALFTVPKNGGKTTKGEHRMGGPCVYYGRD